MTKSFEDLPSFGEKPAAPAAPVVTRISDPPREIPFSLMLRILVQFGVCNRTFFSLIAAGLQFAATTREDPFERRVLFALGAIVLLLALKSLVPALFRATGVLHRMRVGVLAPAQVLSCRLPGAKKSAAVQYGEFLCNWPSNIGKMQVAGYTGCLSSAVMLIFVGPLVVAMLIVAAVVIGHATGHPLGSAPLSPDLDTRFLGQWFGMGLYSIAVAVVMILVWRGQFNFSGKGRHDTDGSFMTGPSANATYDDCAQILLARARAEGQAISLTTPLPVEKFDFRLQCEVEYFAGGDIVSAEGQIMLTDRLDVTGIEPLLFVPGRTKQVEMLAGLPEEARIDADGQWSKAPAFWPAIRIGMAGLFALAAIAACAWILHGFTATLDKQNGAAVSMRVDILSMTRTQAEVL